MTVEHAHQTPQTVERDFFTLPELTTEDMTLLGQNSVDTKDIPETTADVVILGDNEYYLPFESTAQEERPPLEERIESGLQSSIQGFDSWLLVKTRDAVAVQLFQSGLDEASIDIAQVAALLEQEVTNEHDRHTEDAERLEEVIPAAELRDKAGYSADHSYIYGREDIENLRERSGVHRGMSAFTGSMLHGGEEWAVDLARGYVERVQESAKKAATIALRTSELTHYAEEQAA